MNPRSLRQPTDIFQGTTHVHHYIRIRNLLLGRRLRNDPINRFTPGQAIPLYQALCRDMKWHHGEPHFAHDIGPTSLNKDCRLKNHDFITTRPSFRQIMSDEPLKGWTNNTVESLKRRAIRKYNCAQLPPVNPTIAFQNTTTEGSQDLLASASTGAVQFMRQ